MQSEEATASLLLALEQRLLDPAVRSRPEEVERLLAPGFVEIGSSGRRYDRAEIIAALADEARGVPPERRLEDFRLCMLAADIALVTYVAHRRSPGGEMRTLRSSIWRWSGEGWRMLFRQGTPAA